MIDLIQDFIKDKIKNKLFENNHIWWILVIIINLYAMIVVVYTTYRFMTPLYVAFPWFLAAVKSKDKKAWLRAVGVLVVGYIIHTAIFLYDIFVIGYIEDFNKQNTALYATIWIREFFWGGLIIFALRIRNEVAGKVAAVKNGKRKAVRNMGIVPVSEKIKENSTVMVESKAETKEGTEKLDINLCDETEFMTLPGMSLASAKKAVENRKQNGNYESFDDFVFRNGIKPHFMVQMEKLVLVSENGKAKSIEAPKRGRMLDL